jgi:hypothetical protein
MHSSLGIEDKAFQNCWENTTQNRQTSEPQYKAKKLRQAMTITAIGASQLSMQTESITARNYRFIPSQYVISHGCSAT